MKRGVERYRMPAEWEPHEATWLAWPVNRQTWPGAMLGRVRKTYLEMISRLIEDEKVRLLVPDRATGIRLEKYFGSPRFYWHRFGASDAWIRDYGPIFVESPDRTPTLTRWRFNAWGGKYPEMFADGRLTASVPYLRRMKKLTPGLVLEGGSIEVNGQGLLLTTEQCLLNPNRNPGMTKTGIERVLARYLGVRRVIWLKGGIAGDDTDGHVDDVARFAGPDTVLACHENDKRDVNYEVLRENIAILKKVKFGNGRHLKIVKIPMPAPIYSSTGKRKVRLPASFLNYYISNKKVLLPVFRSLGEDRISRTIARIFPSRKIEAIYAKDILHGFGTIHCVTQQEPALFISREKI